MRLTTVFMCAAVLVFATGCAESTSLSSAPAVRFTVTNALAAPVTISIDGTVTLLLPIGGSSGLTVPPTAQWLTWMSSKPTDTTGTPIPDDINEVRVRVSAIGSALEITNLINDTTYVTPQMLNPTSARVSIGVYQGTTVVCASVLRAASGSVSGFTKIGYYRLLAGTEIRAYRDESRCTGPYVAWPATQLRQFIPKSGLVSLTLSSAP